MNNNECKTDVHIEICVTKWGNEMSPSEIWRALQKLIQLGKGIARRMKLSENEDLKFRIFDGGDCIIADAMICVGGKKRCSMQNRIKVFPKSPKFCIIGVVGDQYLPTDKLSDVIADGFRRAVPKPLET